MSDKREIATKSVRVASFSATKPDSFHEPNYSSIVGIMPTNAIKASLSVGCQASAASASSTA